MRVIVCVKQVMDPRTVKVSRSREELDLREALLITNPADKHALEAALRLRDATGNADVIALTVGPATAEDAAREAIAMGADRAVLVDTGTVTVTGAAVTRLLSAAVNRIGAADLVLTGAVGGFDGTGGTAPRLAAELGWPVLVDVARLTADMEGWIATVARAGGAERRPVTLPAVLAMRAGVDRPRYPHPARIAHAWDAGLLEVWNADTLGVTLVSDLERGGLILAPERTRGQVLRGEPAAAAAELVNVLRARRVI